MKKISKLLIASMAVSLMIACGGPTVEIEYETPELTFKLEPPFFAGPNTIQAELDLSELNEQIKQAGGKPGNVVKAVTTEVTFTSLDSLSSFDLVESILVQLFNDDIDLTKIAGSSPLPEVVNNSINITVANEQKIEKFFNKDKLFIVVDINMTEDNYEDYFTLAGKLKFKINVKQ